MAVDEFVSLAETLHNTNPSPSLFFQKKEDALRNGWYGWRMMMTHPATANLIYPFFSTNQNEILALQYG